ncbi:MAG: nicotinate (nicotinamide) nucleotide adenylyltransferase [Omnitrophica bacterium RIFCSPLOWO2_12_FULL_45_13]|nr:MAG: nicotinate (nicotinamide) nucleotide adenylyltransferase [Omnitrophica bacterium RIFCSPLOWO2_12_FULL_45_13]
MRIGILGGTFNPIHIGHLILAEEARFKLRLDKLILVPAFMPPHKNTRDVIDAKDRLEMVRLAIEDNPAFEISTYEVDSKKKSYSIDTLKEFRKIYGDDAQLCFITGSDSLKDLFSWKNINDIFKISKFIVANRPGYPLKDIPKEADTVVITPIEVSSEDIRKRLKEGRSIRYLVSEKVRKYILEHNLYRLPNAS